MARCATPRALGGPAIAGVLIATAGAAATYAARRR